MTKTSLNTLKYLRQTGVEEVANLMEDYHISKQLALEIINIYFEKLPNSSCTFIKATALETAARTFNLLRIIPAS